MGQNEGATALDVAWHTQRARFKIALAESVQLSEIPGPEVAFDIAWLGPKKGLLLEHPRIYY